MDTPHAKGKDSLALEVGLAEYNALRGEIIALTTIKATYLGTGLTAAGLLMTLALQGGLFRDALLTIPFLALAIVAVSEAESVKVLRVGRYIREDLWPHLQEIAGYPLSWEARRDPIRESRARRVALSTLEYSAPMLLIALSIFSLVIYPPTDVFSFGAAVLALVLTSLLPIAVPAIAK